MTDYRIIKSNRRTLSLEITKTCEVVVRAPKYASEKEIEHFVLSHTDWIEKSLQKVASRIAKCPPPTEQELKLLKKSAKEYLPKRLEELSKICGLSYEKLTITSAQTRFGSCSSKNTISLSCLLMRYPSNAIDYVIIHELCHTVHHNHSKDFWNLVEKYLPDYKLRQNLLR